nr:hypothetical protein [Bacteroidota bacterium]
MKRILMILMVSGLLATTACTTYRTASVAAPVNIQVIIDYDNMDYVGEVTGTATQSFALGLPIGGQRYRVAVASTAGGNILPGNNRGINNALYEALKQKPDADFLIPFSVQETRNVMFLGSKRTYTVKAKAFKIKAK